MWNTAGRRAHVSVCTCGQEAVTSWMAQFLWQINGFVCRLVCDGGVGLAAAVSHKLEPMTGLVWLVLTQIFGSSDSIPTTVSSEAADLMEPFLRSFSQSESLAAECRRLGPFAFLALVFKTFTLRETCSQEQPL